ncbi:methyltransferase family protein [Bacteroidota bacterium]
MASATTFEFGFWNAWIFMSAFIFQMMFMMLAGKQISKRSHVPSDAKRTTLEKYTGMMANFIWFITLIYSIFLPLLLGTIWFYIGFFIFSLGLLLLFFSTFDFMTTPVDQMIQKGVYKFSRHPMYLATFLICLGSGIATASWIFILLSIAILVCFHYEARLEERYCLEKYKDLYRVYMQKVPMWFGIPQ